MQALSMQPGNQVVARLFGREQRAHFVVRSLMGDSLKSYGSRCVLRIQATMPKNGKKRQAEALS